MRIPKATYRVQLNAAFNFQQLTNALDYLAILGISDLYASPIFKARRGSTHGYDGVDPEQLNPELGSEADWNALNERRRSLNLGWLQDIVPNHMAYSAENPRIRELLENGPTSDVSDFFDIIWDHPRQELNGRLSAPFLGTPLDQCLEKGEIGLRYEAGGLYFAYHEHRFPLALKSYPQVLAENMEISRTKEKLRTRYEASPDFRQRLARRLAYFNAAAQRPALARLLAQQCFHLDHWQHAARAINYRRFFSINDLIAVRQESPGVFEQTHGLIRRMSREGLFTGLRVDHIDGLLTPGSYLQALRAACGDGYLVVEKIVSADETLPDNWPIQGTTGYEFAAHLDRLFTCGDHQERLDAVCAEFCGDAPDFDAVTQRSKTEVLNAYFLGDLDNLAAKFKALAPFAADPTDDLAAALGLIVVRMPVYRTYRSDGGRYEQDNEFLRHAVAAAVEAFPDLTPTLVRLDRFMRAPVENDELRTPEAIAEEAPRRSAMGAFEQLCAAMAAKGVEDTALYRFHRLAALNEVGADPGRFGESREAFHQFILRRRQRFPHALNALSTHDSKRSGDVRARLSVLAEMPDLWAARVRAWRELNRRPRPTGKTVHRTDPAMTYLLYQTLAATCPAGRSGWPDYVERIVAYMLKAAREAKHFTDWGRPDPAYESGLEDFIRGSLDPEGNEAFLADCRTFAQRVAFFGGINSLAQTLIQLTAPGVPDIYQGTELVNDSLVDPDNRRPVDYPARRRMLAEVGRIVETHIGEITAPLFGADPSMLKLYLIHTALQARRQDEAVFAAGEYLPLTISGPRQRHGLGFARTLGERWYLSVVPRFFCALASEEGAGNRPDLWLGTRLTLPAQAPRRWRNLLSRAGTEARHGALALQDLFAPFPVALLRGEV